MSKYQYTDKMREISGFGGEYENACRKMVITGLEWIDDHPNPEISWKEYKDVTGIITDLSPHLEEMTTAMNEAIGNEASGAMIQFCVHHVVAANRLGWDKYVEEMEKEEKEEN